MFEGFTKRLAEATLLAGILAVFGCSSLSAPVTVKSAQQGGRVTQLKASSFKFEPNNIRVPEPGPLTIEVENISDIEHNITIKNPQGEVIKSADLPAMKTVALTLTLPGPGKYEFYCDKPIHDLMGMNGQLQVGS
jgi:plastocyanin